MPPPLTRRAAGGVAILAAAAAVQWVPSVVSLGQWLPVRVAPGGWCRWRGAPGTGVALTFDDGPDPATTPAVLDALDRLGLRATFFPIGTAVARHPGLVREVVERGHLVGTHGFRHHHHLGKPPGWAGRDLDAALAALRDAGVVPRWYRPPYGQASGPTLLAAHRRGLRTVLWSAWGREWAAPTVGSVAARIIPELVPGAVVLLHDSDAFSPAGSAARALGALDAVAARLDERGLRAVTLDEVVAA